MLDAPGEGPRFRVLARVSDDKLRSIPQQVRECMTYAGERGARVDAIYNVGEHSGFSMSESPVYRQLLDDAREHRFEGLIIRDSSRLGRDYWEKLGTLRDLRAAKVELHVLEEGGRFDFDDRLAKVKSWASTWADEEKKREEIRKSVRATSGLREMGLPTTTPPYGYASRKDAKLGRRVWVATSEGETVRAIFASYLEAPHTPLAQLARRHGLTQDHVRGILANRAYIGGFTWAGAFHKCDAAVVPPLVDETTFERVQALRGAPRRGRPRTRARADQPPSTD